MLNKDKRGRGMSRYIDADALIKRFFPYDVADPKCYSINAKAVYEEIRRSPTADVVEVVRCKDCKYCRTLKDGGSQCERLDGLLMTKPTDYCSYGERREK